MLPMIQRSIAPGISLIAVRTQKFKTSMMGVNFAVPLSRDTASCSALLPQVLRRGTQAHPNMERLSAALDELYGGGIEPIVRKKGEVQCIGFWGSFLDDAFVPERSQVLEDAAVLLGKLVLQPAGSGDAFVPEYVDSERANLVDRIRSEKNDKRQYATARLRSQMCQGEAYGVGKLGTEEEAGAITGETLFRRYRQIAEKAPVCFYYCGSADADRVEAAFRRAFADLPQGEREEIPTTLALLKPLGEPRYFEEQMEVTQGKLAIGFRSGGAFRGKHAMARGMLFNAVYGGSTNSKLFLNVREKLSLCYFASSSLVLSKGLLFVSSGVEFSNFQRAREEILAQLEACKMGEITQEELESARRSVIGSLRTTLDAQGRLEDYWLSRFAAGTDTPPEEIAQAVAEVTMEQVVDTAKGVTLDSVYFLRGKGE